jgi:small subunit ribosomal protein S3Ae
MAERTKKAKRDKKKIKKWFPITAPSVFKDQVLGEIPVTDISELLGRKVSINLMSATRDFKHQDITITFRVDQISGNTAQCNVSSYRLSPSPIKRMIRRKSDRIDLRAELTTGDKKKALIKVIAVTLNNTYSGVRTKLREEGQKFLKEYVKKQGYTSLVMSIIVNKLQREMKSHLNKLYPVRFIIVNQFSLIGEAEADAIPEMRKAEEPKSEKPEPAKAEKSEQEKPAELEQKPKRKAVGLKEERPPKPSEKATPPEPEASAK